MKLILIKTIRNIDVAKIKILSKKSTFFIFNPSVQSFFLENKIPYITSLNFFKKKRPSVKYFLHT